jgi:hypothetical protein
MPTYEYRCPANGRTVEVSHPMADSVKTWGDLCARAGIDPGNTAPGEPVEKAVTLGFVRSGKSGPGPAGPCGAGCGCHPH